MRAGNDKRRHAALQDHRLDEARRRPARLVRLGLLTEDEQIDVRRFRQEAVSHRVAKYLAPGKTGTVLVAQSAQAGSLEVVLDGLRIGGLAKRGACRIGVRGAHAIAPDTEQGRHPCPMPRRQCLRHREASGAAGGGVQMQKDGTDRGHGSSAAQRIRKAVSARIGLQA